MSCFNERFNCSKQIIGIHSIPVFTVIFSENPELDCPFCTLPKARVLDANSTGIVIRDGFPISPGHTLVIPRAHVGSLFEITHQQFSDLHELLHRAKESLQAEFAPDGYNIGINDGAAAVVLMEKSAAEKQGLKPMARLVSYGLAGVDPKIMGIGPVPACTIAMNRAGLKIGDIDVVEANEAFAVQAMAVACDLKFDPKKTNPNGGAVGLGHPIGATGALLTVKAIYELQRTGSRYAMVTMCIGGGQGIAAIFQRM